jgi:hypothetical protein
MSQECLQEAEVKVKVKAWPIACSSGQAEKKIKTAQKTKTKMKCDVKIQKFGDQQRAEDKLHHWPNAVVVVLVLVVVVVVLLLVVLALVGVVVQVEVVEEDSTLSVGVAGKDSSSNIREGVHLHDHFRHLRNRHLIGSTLSLFLDSKCW